MYVNYKGLQNLWVGEFRLQEQKKKSKPNLIKERNMTLVYPVKVCCTI